MATHKEIGFEDVICDHLAAQGWLYAPGDAAAYDREHALFPADLVAWATETQAKPWADAVAKLGEKALLDRIRKSLDERGTLEVLRKGGRGCRPEIPADAGAVSPRDGHEL
jgi:type I restriction enzyme R subunit